MQLALSPSFTFYSEFIFVDYIVIYSRYRTIIFFFTFSSGIFRKYRHKRGQIFETNLKMYEFPHFLALKTPNNLKINKIRKSMKSTHPIAHPPLLHDIFSTECLICNSTRISYTVHRPQILNLIRRRIFYPESRGEGQNTTHRQFKYSIAFLNVIFEFKLTHIGISITQ